MSNINTVINFIKLEPDYNKEDMVQKIMKTLNVTKSNAQVYLYNANKKLGKVTPAKTHMTKPAKVSRAEIVQKSDEEIARIKDERLARMKEIGERRVRDREAERLAEREAKYAEMDEFNDQAKVFIDSLTAPMRKFIAGAE
jgi:predicted RNA-binding protein Jag